MNRENLKEYLDKLNPEQHKAATYINGSCLVLAAAGSGKTSTLISRIAFLIAFQNIMPQNILAVTFTNKAAKEMNNRLFRMGLDTKQLWIGTFHGICNKILRLHAKEAGLSKNFYIMDQQEQLSFLKRTLRANDYDPKVVDVGDLQNKINGYKEVGWRSNQLRSGSQERKFYEFYEKACIQDNCVDFAELLLGCYELFEKNPQIESHYAEKFKHILVDEFQDTNELQYKWMKKLGAIHRNVFAVGDDDQCLVKGTRIDTPYGDVLIENIKIGDAVHSKVGKTTVKKRVTNKFKHIFNGELVNIVLENGTVLQSTKEHIWFANFLKGSSPKKYFTYLGFRKDIGYFTDTSEMNFSKNSLIGKFKNSDYEKTDKLWILSVNDSLEYAKIDELKYCKKYKVLNKSALLDNYIDYKGQDGNQINNAVELLKDIGLNIRSPHYIFRSKNNIILTLCAENKKNEDKNEILHSLEFFTKNNKLKDSLEQSGLSFQKINKSMYKYLKLSSNYNDILKVTEQIEQTAIFSSCSVNIIQKANIGKSPILHILAKNLLPDMIMIDRDGKKQKIKSVNIIKSQDEVYDLNIQDTHNYIANGIVTHNSIYAFRGAKPENLNLFKSDFNAQLIKVEKNYRSDAYILEAANEVIKNNTNRQGKNLVPTKPASQKIALYNAFNDEQESMFIATEMKKLRRSQIPYKEMAILYRTNGQSRSLEKALNAQSIPYIVYGGFRFFERQEVKHAMAYLRLANNPNDNMAFLRVANIPARAIGETALKKLDMVANENKCSLYQATLKISEKDKKKYQPFLDVVDTLQMYCQGKSISEMTRIVIEHSGLENMYVADKKEGEERLDNLYELISAAEVFMQENNDSDLDEFLAFSTLDSDMDKKKKEDNTDSVKLMTVHSSKGLEFECVFLSGLEESLFPHANSLGDPNAIEEERRLMYVALTRAKKALYISLAEERMVHGQRSRFLKSRFLKEIPKKLIQNLN